MRSKMSSTISYQRFLILFLPLLAISLSIVYALNTPREFERFMSISTFGSDDLMAGYYHDLNFGINVEKNVTWYIHVFNRMGNSELIAIRIKLLNATELAPTVDHKPSPVKPIYQVEHLLKNNATFVFPLKWKINSIEKENDYIIIRNMTINDKIIDDLDVRSIKGEDFRLVIELWRYNPESNRYEFAWQSNTGIRSVWNQIWFNLR